MENLKHFLLALCAATAAGFVSIIFVFRWVLYFKEGLAWDGGLAEFNWHPVLTVTGFIFLQGIAIIVYRLPWTWQCSKLMMKFIHAGLNLLAFVFAVIAMVAVFDFHNGANIPNMYSLHSWLGLTAVILYGLQLVLGVGMYLIPVYTCVLESSVYASPRLQRLLLFTSVIAVALMGITEKLIFGLKDPKYKDSPPRGNFCERTGSPPGAFWRSDSLDLPLEHLGNAPVTRSCIVCIPMGEVRTTVKSLQHCLNCRMDLMLTVLEMPGRGVTNLMNRLTDRKIKKEWINVCATSLNEQGKSKGTHQIVTFLYRSLFLFSFHSRTLKYFILIFFFISPVFM
uniref:Plasma membrane ascorbate-dependent reductase CYBRD1 n=1 Tax=Astatotilapia calliptera TaxID=8154 RepID=A0A3P8PC88_ASTCA